MGKHNQLHTHAFPFILAPLINLNLLGDEGLSDVGFSTAILLPATSWFSELTLQYIRGEGVSIGALCRRALSASLCKVRRVA